MIQEIAKIHTCCKNCVFAKYDNITQTGCWLNYIDVFKTKNIDILQAYDEDKEFYIINEKHCIGYTKPEALIKYELDKAPIQQIIGEYQKLNKLNYIAVIDAKSINLDQITKIVDDLSKMEVKPQKIVIIRYPDINNKIPYYSLSKLFDNINIKWKIISAKEMTTAIDTFINTTAVVESNYRFMLLIKDVEVEAGKLVNTANTIVHKDLDQFILLKDKNSNGMIFSTAVYRYDKFMGNNLLIDSNKHTVI
jgi:hypothetical protein